jgi:non-specific serine/threonine protein kinase
LTLPDIHHLPPIEALSQYEAVNLFIDRATLAQPHFTVTNDNAPAIAQICYRLDGIPLAIELAAARVKILDVEQINKRLDNRFHLLTDGSRTSLPRHQTLRATIDWSYELLSDQEKVLFRRLAVFTGGWTLEAAEQVCNVEESPMDIFDALAHLVDKSLVIMDSSTGEARHHMLETTRQYAHEKLLASNEREVLRNRHYDWYFELAECGKRELQGANQLLWLHRLDSELDNLRSALEWAFASSRRDTKGMQMVCNLMEFWDYSSYFSEGFAWLEKAEKESLAFMETPIRAKILYHYGYWTTLIKGNWKAGRSLLVESLETFRKLGIAHRLDLAYTESWLGYFLYFRDNEHETGCIYLKEAIEIFQEAGERRGHGWALNLFSEVKSYERDIKTALAMAEEGVALYTSCGDRLGTAICGLQLGFCNMRPGAYAYEKAIRFMDDALEVFKEFGSRMWISLTLNSLGEAHRGLREYDEAEACYRESLFVQKEACMMPNWFIGNRLGLGYAVLYRGDNDQATLIFKEALVLSKKHKREVELIHSLAGCAAVAAAKGNAEDSALLYGAVDYLFQKFLANGEKLDSLIDPTDSREFERYQALCRSKLGNSAFESALRRGYGITLDQAITFALEQVDR